MSDIERKLVMVNGPKFLMIPNGPGLWRYRDFNGNEAVIEVKPLAAFSGEKTKYDMNTLVYKFPMPESPSDIPYAAHSVERFTPEDRGGFIQEWLGPEDSP